MVIGCFSRFVLWHHPSPTFPYSPQQQVPILFLEIPCINFLSVPLSKGRLDELLFFWQSLLQLYLIHSQGGDLGSILNTIISQAGFFLFHLLSCMQAAHPITPPPLPYLVLFALYFEEIALAYTFFFSISKTQSFLILNYIGHFNGIWKDENHPPETGSFRIFFFKQISDYKQNLMAFHKIQMSKLSIQNSLKFHSSSPSYYMLPCIWSFDYYHF